LNGKQVLIVPGLNGSGAAHWQSRWEARHPHFRRVEQSDWERPEQQAWLQNLDAAVTAAGPQTLLVAHSLGCLLVAHWAVHSSRPIHAALLVAPPNPERDDFPPQISGFRPLPRQPLPFPSLVVASSNDPYGSADYAAAIATVWGSRYLNIGPAGHINADSGLGDWPQGLELLRSLT
jgi:predicted alpha/beta hydrolase family esterase